MPNDLPGLIPSSVTVVFPQASNGVATGTSYTIAVTLLSLNLPEYAATPFTPNHPATSAIVGHAGTHLVHSSAVANFTGGGSPANVTELTNLAAQISQDFFLWRLSAADVALMGICPYTPEGLSDFVEWLHRDGDAQCRTHVHPGQRQDWTDSLNHYGTYGSLPPPIPAMQVGDLTVTKSLTVSGTLNITPVKITISGNTNNLVIPTGTYFNVTVTGGNWNITGITAPLYAQTIYLTNISTTNYFTLINQSGSSSPGNLLFNLYAENVYVYPGQTVQLIYNPDPSQATWLVFPLAASLPTLIPGTGTGTGTPVAGSIQWPIAVGTNIAAGTGFIYLPQSTGNATAGVIIIQGGLVTTSGSTPQTNVNIISFSASGITVYVGITFDATVTFAASTLTTYAFVIPVGVATTTLVAGGVYFDGTNLTFYNGTTNFVFAGPGVLPANITYGAPSPSPNTVTSYAKTAYIMPKIDDGSGTPSSIGISAVSVVGTPTNQVDARGAWQGLASAATTNQAAGWSTVGNHVYTELNPVLEWIVEFPNATDFGSGNNSRVWIGVSSNTTTLLGQDTLNNLSGLAFRLSSGTSDTKWQVAVNNGGASAPAVVDSGVTVTANTKYVLKIDCSNNASIIFSINGTALAPISSTLPGTTTGMTQVCANRTLANVTKNFYIALFQQWQTG